MKSQNVFWTAGTRKGVHMMTRSPSSLIVILVAHLLAMHPVSAYGQPASGREGVGELSPAVATRVTGKLMCSVREGPGHMLVEIPNVPFEIRNVGSEVTRDDGSFSIQTAYSGNSVHLKLVYDGRIAGPAAGVSSRLQIMNEGHNTRSDEFDRSGTISNHVLALGTVELGSPDCELWRIGAMILKDYHAAVQASPPAGQLRIKRWSGVVVGTPHTFYDYVVVRTDFVDDQNTRLNRELTLFHEFGHTVRHVADGDEGHWNGDNFRWAYARDHNGGEVANVQYAFNEGWANYWSQARRNRRATYASPLAGGYRDWNEELVANRLLSFSPAISDKNMVELLVKNRGAIHSLHEFEVKMAELLSQPTPPTPASCPPAYTDDGATCRRDVHVTAKPSYGRGAGTAPNSCAASQTYDTGLCYPSCNLGFHGVGPVCWGTCPAGYDDHGGTCYRGPSIIGSDNSRCPGYDKCGLTLAQGCSSCPEGYANDGCTCRIDVHVIAKPSYGRGAGTAPNSCAAGQTYDTGLCYPSCNLGFHGVGPVCWGTCSAGYDDHGGTCYRGTSIIIKF